MSECTDLPAFTPGAYVRDRWYALLLLVLCLGALVFLLPLLGVSGHGTMLVADLVTLFALLAAVIDYQRRAAWYRELAGLLSQLRRASAFAALVSDPPFLEGAIAYEAAAQVGRLSATEVEALGADDEAYRRYIELWIHEIKTPMAAVKLMCANDGGPLASKIARELERIEAQVDQALYYARSTSLSQDYTIREVDLAEAAREACKRNARFLIERGCTPSFEIPEGLTVLADEPWLVFMLGQLVANAAKYGASTLTFTAREQEPDTPRGRTVLEVRDNGCGIPAKDVPRVFERGFTGVVGRAHGSATGMGLFLVASLCAAMGLHVGLASEEGEGTRVILTFPHDRARKELLV